MCFSRKSITPSAPVLEANGARQSSAVDRALKAVQRGMTPYRAAKKEGIAFSTIYRALKRHRRAKGE